MDKKECWLCHRKQEEILKFAEDKTCSQYLAESIFGNYEYEKTVFYEIDVLGTKVPICPICFYLIQNIVLKDEYFEDRFDELLSGYRVQISGHLVAEESEGEKKEREGTIVEK